MCEDGKLVLSVIKETQLNEAWVDVCYSLVCGAFIISLVLLMMVELTKLTTGN